MQKATNLQFMGFYFHTHHHRSQKLKTLSRTSSKNPFHPLYNEDELIFTTAHGISCYTSISFYQGDNQLCPTLSPSGGCWIPSLERHFWCHSPPSRTSYSFGASPRACNTKVSKEQEGAECNAMGETISSYSIICFIGRVWYHTTDGFTKEHLWDSSSQHWMGQTSPVYRFE